MRNLFTETSEKLLSNTDLLETYENLAKYWKKESFQIGYCACLEKIWHLTKDSNIIINLANTVSIDIKDERGACLLRAMMFYNYSPDTFIKFLQSVNMDEDFIKELQYEANTTPWILLSGRYLIYTYLMIFAIQKKDLELVMDLSKNLIKFETEIKDYIENHNLDCDSNQNDYLKSKSTLSEFLSEIEHHNDINKLAIYLNPNNEKAYLNIVEDLLTYKNFNEAKEFYNNQYAIRFNKTLANSISDICWNLSHHHSKNYNFYKTLVYQKLALEIQLQEK